MTNGELWQQTWEELMMWKLNSDFIDLSGRDIIVFITGFLIALMICGLCEGRELHVNIFRRRKNKNIP